MNLIERSAMNMRIKSASFAASCEGLIADSLISSRETHPHRPTTTRNPT